MVSTVINKYGNFIYFKYFIPIKICYISIKSDNINFIHSRKIFLNYLLI